MTKNIDNIKRCCRKFGHVHQVLDIIIWSCWFGHVSIPPRKLNVNKNAENLIHTENDFKLISLANNNSTKFGLKWIVNLFWFGSTHTHTHTHTQTHTHTRLKKFQQNMVWIFVDEFKVCCEAAKKIKKLRSPRVTYCSFEMSGFIWMCVCVCVCIEDSQCLRL